MPRRKRTLSDITQARAATLEIEGPVIIDTKLSKTIESINNVLKSFVTAFKPDILKKEQELLQKLNKNIFLLEKNTEKEVTLVETMVNVQKRMVNRLNDIFLSINEMIEKISYLLVENRREGEKQRETWLSLLRKYLVDPWVDIWKSIWNSLKGIASSLVSHLLNAVLGSAAVVATLSLTGFDAIRMLPNSLKTWIYMMEGLPADLKKYHEIIKNVGTEVEYGMSNFTKFIVYVKKFNKMVVDSIKTLENFVEGKKINIKLTLLSRYVYSLVSENSFMIKLYESVLKFYGVVKPYADFMRMKIDGIIKTWKLFINYIDDASNPFIVKLLRFLENSKIISIIDKGIDGIIKGLKFLPKILHWFVSGLKFIENITNKTFAQGAKLFDVIENMASWVTNFISRLGKIGSAFVDSFGWFGRSLKFIFGRLMFWFLLIWDFFEGFFGEWDKELGVVERIKRGVINMIRGFLFEPLDVLKNLLAWMVSWISKDSAKWIRENINFTKWYDNYIVPFISSPIKWLTDAIFPWIGTLLNSLFGDVLNDFQESWNNLVNNFSLKSVGSFLTMVAMLGVKIIEKLIKFVAGLFGIDFDKLKKSDKIKKMLKSLTDIIIHPIEAIKDFFKWLFSSKSLRAMMKGVLEGTGIGKWIGGTDWILDKVFGKATSAEPVPNNVYKSVTEKTGTDRPKVLINDNSINLTTVPQRNAGGTYGGGNIPVSTEPSPSVSKLLRHGLGRN